MAGTYGDWKQSLNLNGQILASGQVATAGFDTTIYQVPTGKQAKVATFTLTNTDPTNNVIVSLSVVPGGSVIDGHHKLLPSINLPASSIYEVPLTGAFLETGAIISVNAGTGAVLNYLITGALSS